MNINQPSTERLEDNDLIPAVNFIYSMPTQRAIDNIETIKLIHFCMIEKIISEILINN
jgi:hypothetical protein